MFTDFPGFRDVTCHLGLLVVIVIEVKLEHFLNNLVINHDSFYSHRKEAPITDMELQLLIKLAMIIESLPKSKS